MQSDEDDFGEAVESHTPDRKIQNPGDRFPLRRTPARKESEKLREAKMDQQNLFEGLIRHSVRQRENTRGGRAHSQLRQSKRAQENESLNLCKHHERRENSDENGSKYRCW